jgi:hypothetical protein
MNTKKIKQILRKFFIHIFMIQTVGLIVITSLFIYSHRDTKELMARQVSRIVEGRIKTGDNRGAVYALSSAKLEDFNAVGYFGKNDKRIFTLPSMLEPNFFKHRSLLDKFINSTVKVDLYYASAKKKKMGQLIFVFNIFKPLFTGIVVWLIMAILSIPFIRKYRSLLVQNLEKEMEYRHAQFAQVVARQVRHDLAGAMQQIFDIAEKQKETTSGDGKALLSAISRIEKTLQDLPGKKAILGKTKKEKARVHHIAYIVKSFVDQRAPGILEKHGAEIKTSGLDQFVYAKVQGNDFYRCIQNMVENALQAGAYIINLDLKDMGETIELLITDDGSGISKDNLAKVTQHGFSQGKINGSGIGLSFVKQKVRSWGGKLKIYSEVGSGSCFSIVIKKLENPNYAPEKEKIDNFSTLVVIDDDANIHEKMHKLFKSSGKKMISFFTSQEFERFLVGRKKNDFFAFVDYDLGRNSKNGIEMIKSNRVEKNSILLSAHYDEESVIQACRRLNIKIHPKSLVNAII